MRRNECHLLEMLVAARDAAEFCDELTYSEFATSGLHQNAILKSLEIIGEAASRIDDKTKRTHSGIPWANIVGLRKRIVHAYFQIDLEIVWSVVKDEVPNLIGTLTQIVSTKTKDQKEH